MHWEIMPHSQDLGKWWPLWDELNERLYGGHPLRDSRFVESMIQYFGKPNLQLCAHKTQGVTDGLILMYPRRSFIWTQFVPSQAQAAPILIDRMELLRGLFPSLSHCAAIIEFICQDPHFVPKELLFDDIDNILADKHALTMNIDLSGTFDEYWNSRSKKLISNINRYHRRVKDRAGSGRLELFTEPGMMHDAVVRFGELESSGWKGRAGTAVNINNAQGEFYSEVMTKFAETNQAEVAEYWIGEHLAASRLVIYNKDIQVMLKTAFDESLSQFAPGRLLLHEYLKHSFINKRSKHIEFYTNATKEQLAWATGQRYLRHIMLFRSTHIARLYNHYRKLRRTHIDQINDPSPTSALESPEFY